jgi:murein DD-endopeptidase MepM/ murein hydrolase activator NlpD
MLKHIFISCCLFFTFHFVTAQEFPTKNYPVNYFRQPHSIPIKLNANFGEMRPNHFHMGLDYNTLKKENIPQVAVADGYVGRIKIEPGGFGNAIYLYHPNGYTTLYAHLNNFYPELQQWVKEQQYKLQSWRVELEVPANLFPLKKGQFIAYSGNTGGSQGPHLHFEIRRTSDDACLNPLLFYKFFDITPPDITKLVMYDRNLSTYEQWPRTIGLSKTTNGYGVAGGTITVSSDKISFGVTATDRITGVPNSNGFYEAVIYLDDQPVSGFQLDGIDYLQTRYLNAHIDHKIKAAGGSYVQHLSPLPGDRLPVYKKWNNDGLIYLNDTALHRIRITIKDVNGNASSLNFNVRRTNKYNKPNSIIQDNRYMLPNQINIFDREDVELFMSEKGLYDAIRFVYNYKAKVDAYSNIHILHTHLIPVHDTMIIRIKPNKPVPASVQSKIIMVKSVKGKPDVKKANFSNGKYEASFREFGEFWLAADTTQPTLAVLGIQDRGILNAGGKIMVITKDNWEKLKNFRASLNGKWLMFSQRGNNYTYKVDEYCPPGEYELKLIIEDEAGNSTEKVIRFTRK